MHAHPCHVHTHTHVRHTVNSHKHPCVHNAHIDMYMHALACMHTHASAHPTHNIHTHILLPHMHTCLWPHSPSRSHCRKLSPGFRLEAALPPGPAHLHSTARLFSPLPPGWSPFALAHHGTWVLACAVPQAGMPLPLSTPQALLFLQNITGDFSPGGVPDLPAGLEAPPLAS